MATLLVLATACSAPVRRPTPAPTPVDPIESALAADFNGYLNDDQIRAVIVMVNGRTRFERYYGRATADQTLDLHSVTKSVVSTLVGDAIAEGRLRLDETLPQMLPQYASRMTSPERRVALAELLTMTGGFRETWLGGDPDPGPETDWTMFSLANQTQAPPTAFAYSDVGVQLLAPILIQATGQSLLDYARSHLFDPLGIPSRPAFQAPVDDAHMPAFMTAGFAWGTDPRGVDMAFAYLKIRPRDMARFGQLFLQGGQWNGRQLVPADWVRDATAVHTDIALAAGSFGPYRPLGYGYLWWISSVGGVPAFFAWGFGGQLIEVVPQMQLVAVIATSTEQNATTGPLGPGDAQRIATAIAAAVRSGSH